jgi:hypothetical protein
MSSILEGQIDLLASQAQSLAGYGEHAGATANMAEAVAVALAPFGTLEVTTDPCQLSQLSVLKRWLEGAEALLEPIRRARVQGGHIARLDQFLRTILRTRSLLADATGPAADTVTVFHIAWEYV